MKKKGVNSFEKAHGLILYLQKRYNTESIGNRSIFNSQEHITLFGNYDDLQIIKANNWFSFSPSGIEASLKEQWPALDPASLRSVESDSYPVKLVFPSNENISKAERKGFSYSPWASNASNPISDLSHPLFSLVLLHMTDAFWHDCSSPSDGIYRLITSIHKNYIKDIQCGVFHSLGSYDFALLVQSKSWNPVFNLIEYLRSNWPIKSDSSKPSVSNIYMLPGFLTNCDKQVLNQLDPNEIIPLRIRLELKPGISLDEFVLSFKQSIQKLWGEEKSTIQYFDLRGRYDYELTVDLPLAKALMLYKENGPLYESHPLNGIIHSNTTIRRIHPLSTNSSHTEKVESIEESPLVPPENSFSLRKEYNDFLDKYESFLTKHHLPLRTSRALCKLFILLQSFEKEAHNADALRLLSPIFNALIQSIYDGIQFIDSQETDTRYSGWVIDKTIFSIERGIDDFRDYVGSYLLNLAFTERPFIERFKLSHESIGSTTKLLFSYNSALNQMVNAVKRPENDGEFNYAFLVVSGGSDRTSASNLFNISPILKSSSTLDTQKLKENRVFIVRLAETSIYDIRGTFLRTFHEAWHYCGNRQRHLRAKKAVLFVSKLLAYSLSEFCYIEKSPDDMVNGPLGCHPKANADQLSEKIGIIYDETLKTFRTEIAEEIEGILSKQIEKVISDGDPTQLYFDPLITVIENELINWLTPTNDSFNDSNHALSALYRSELRNKAYFYSKVEKICQSKPFEGFPAIFNSKKTMCEYYDKHLNEFDAEKIQFFKFCLNAFLGNLISDDVIRDSRFMSKAEQKRFLSKLNYANVYDLLSLMRSSFSESMSDVMSIHILNAPVEDYFLAFLLENDLDRAFPLEPAYAIRIGVTIQCCFPDAIEDYQLSPRVVETFRKQCRKANIAFKWDTGSLSASKIVKRINKLLKLYASYENTGCLTSIKEYLNICMQQVDSEMDDIKELQKMYHIAPGVTSGHLVPYSSIEEFLKFWIKLNK